MTVTDAIGRIAQIQATLVQLDSVATGTATTSASRSTSSPGATDFASALTQALSGASAASPASSSSGGATGADVVADAKKYLGVPYVFGGTSASGLDCSGLVQRVFKDLGIDVPRLVSGQSTVGTEVPSLAQAQPGDIIVCNGGEHIVIYAGDGKVIHAPSEGRTVSLVDNWLKDSDIVTIRRVVPQAAAASSAAAPASALSTAASLSTASSLSTTSSLSTAQSDALRSLLASMLQGSSL
jgi:cell wall-associated NlpC family hydrolase